MGWLSQDFSIPAGNEYTAYFNIFVDGVSSLDGYVVWLQVFEQSCGVPLAGVPPVITKNSLSGGDIAVLDSPPMSYNVSFFEADTVLLLRNYYYESSIIDANNNTITVVRGTLTVTGTEVRE
jgi:hypothetical protein